MIPNTGDKLTFVNQWQSDPTTVIVAVTYATFPTQSAVFLSVNAQQLASTYSSIGYAADATSFVSAAVNIGLTNAPDSLVVPSSATNAAATGASDNAVIKNSLAGEEIEL